MNKQQMKVIEEKVQKIWDDAKVEVKEYGSKNPDNTTITITVYKSYSYVECGLKELISLARIIETDKFDVDESHYNGCETCDYGSSYEKNFSYKLSDVGHWDINIPKD